MTKTFLGFRSFGRWFRQRIRIKIFFLVSETLVNVVKKDFLQLRPKRFADFSCFLGLLHRLCVLLTLTNIPAEILAEVRFLSEVFFFLFNFVFQLINTIAEIIRGHNENQQFFASVINTTSDDQQFVVSSNEKLN